MRPMKCTSSTVSFAEVAFTPATTTSASPMRMAPSPSTTASWVVDEAFYPDEAGSRLTPRGLHWHKFHAVGTYTHTRLRNPILDFINDAFINRFDLVGWRTGIGLRTLQPSAKHEGHSEAQARPHQRILRRGRCRRTSLAAATTIGGRRPLPPAVASPARLERIGRTEALPARRAWSPRGNRSPSHANSTRRMVVGLRSAGARTPSRGALWSRVAGASRGARSLQIATAAPPPRP